MKSDLRGTHTLVNEITSISAKGFWLFVEDHEYFVPFADYPVFKTATIEQIFNFKRIGPENIIGAI